MSHIKDLADPNVDRVLIYAGDHGLYWREGGCGYTNAIEAGVFTRAEAYRLAGHCGPEKLCELHSVPENHLAALKAKLLAAKKSAVIEFLRNIIEKDCGERVDLAAWCYSQIEELKNKNDK